MISFSIDISATKPSSSARLFSPFALTYLRTSDGNAHLKIGSGQLDSLEWLSEAHRGQDVIQLWFKACDEMRFRLSNPSVGSNVDAISPWIDKSNPTIISQFTKFPNRNSYS